MKDPAKSCLKCEQIKWIWEICLNSIQVLGEECGMKKGNSGIRNAPEEGTGKEED